MIEKITNDIFDSDPFELPNSVVELQEAIEINLDKYGKKRLSKLKHRKYKKYMNMMMDKYQELTTINAYTRIN